MIIGTKNRFMRNASMLRPTSHITGFAAASLIAMLGALSMPAYADDSEIFIQQQVTSGATNIMLIIDSSGSMWNTAVSTTTTVLNPYNSTLTYSDGLEWQRRMRTRPGLFQAK